MNLKSAVALSNRLVRKAANGVTVRAEVEGRMLVTDSKGREKWELGPGSSIVFKGGLYGPHSLDLRSSTPQRVMAHWEGYLEASGLSALPKIGQTVTFQSSSSSTGLRTGKVRRLGPRRATIRYVAEGHKRPVSVDRPYSEIIFGRAERAFRHSTPLHSR